MGNQCRLTGDNFGREWEEDGDFGKGHENFEFRLIVFSMDIEVGEKTSTESGTSRLTLN